VGVPANNDRDFNVPAEPVLLKLLTGINDFAKLHQLQDFFINYAKAENKKLTTISI
jgi:hypothetical protein